MKKLLVVLLALTVVGVFAFADDAAAPAAPKAIGTYGSWNDGSVSLIGYDLTTSKSYTSWNNTWDGAATAAGAGSGIDQEWGFGYAGNNFGYSATIEFGGNALNNPLSWFKTYYNLTKWLEIDIGAPRDGQYRTAGTLISGIAGNFFMNKKFGVAATITPIDGLSATLFDHIPYGNSTGWGSVGQSDTDFSHNLAFAAQYSIPNVVTVNAMYQGANVAGSTAAYESVSASITPTKDLTVVLAGSLPNTTYGQEYWGSVGYNLAGGIGVAADVAYANISSSVTGYGAIGQVTYTVDKYVVGLKVGYENNSGVGIHGDDGMSPVQEYGGFGVYPNVQANFDNGSFINLGVSYQSGTNGNDAVIEVPLYYSWSF